MDTSKSNAKARRVHYLQVVGPDFVPSIDPTTDEPSKFDALTEMETRLRFAVGTLVSLSADESVNEFIADSLNGVRTHLEQAQRSLDRLHEIGREAAEQSA